jgi:SNF2 family DNA or RNA helicase
MRYEPHSYQSRATRWVLDHPRCGLFLDMGLGKSVITLTAIRDLIDDCDVSKVLVIAPKKVAESTWSTEADKWDHLRGLRVVKVMGNANARKKALKADADIYVMGRDSVVWLLDTVKNKLPFDMLVLDELTSFKSYSAMRFKAIKRWTAGVSRVVGLTGTPVPNSMMDLWAEMYCIDGGARLGKMIGKYRSDFFTAIPMGGYATKYVIKSGCSGVILSRISDICLTMQASDYLQLPELTEVDDRIDLPTSVKERYDLFEEQQVAQVIDTLSGQSRTVIANSAAGLMSKLSQYADGAVYDSDDHSRWTEIHQEKLDRLSELVEQAQSPVLVFYQFRYDIQRVSEALKGYNVRAYSNVDDLNDWNAGKIDVLLAHPATTAYGLNMQQGGHYIVWLGTGWNLEYYLQANARLHRQGQRHPVTVYRLICRDTIDELAAAAINRKDSTQLGAIVMLKELLRKHGYNDIIDIEENETESKQND